MRRTIAAADWTSATVCAGIFLTVAALSAWPARAQNRWAAVAISPSTGYNGSDSGSTSQASIEQNALQGCRASGRSDCKVVYSVTNQCVALALKTSPVYFAYGIGTTREAAAANALATCTSQGGNGIECHIEEAPCSSDNVRWHNPLPLPPGGSPGLVDPALVGLWKLNVSNGIWVWEISVNGTYTFHSESPDNLPPNAGQFTASNGHYTLHAVTEQWDDLGTYILQSSGVMVASGKLGTGTWYRIASDPGYAEPASAPEVRR
jgi:hypothetical protein